MHSQQIESPTPLSYWHEDAGVDSTPEHPLNGDLDVDVAIVGGGYVNDGRKLTPFRRLKVDPLSC